MFQVKNFHMAILLVNPFDESVAFYQKLGFILKFQIKGKWAEFDLNGVKLGLCPIDVQQPDHRTGFVLEVENLQAMYDALKDSVDFLSEPVAALHGIMVSFRDPAHNILDFYQPTPERVHELMRKSAQEAGGCCKGDNAQCGTDESSC